jgi:hypothetical protein
VRRVGAAVEVPQLFLQFPGAPELVAVTPQQSEDLPVVLVEVFAARANREP